MNLQFDQPSPAPPARIVPHVLLGGILAVKIIQKQRYNYDNLEVRKLIQNPNGHDKTIGENMLNMLFICFFPI